MQFYRTKQWQLAEIEIKYKLEEIKHITTDYASEQIIHAINQI